MAFRLLQARDEGRMDGLFHQAKLIAIQIARVKGAEQSEDEVGGAMVRALRFVLMVVVGYLVAR